MLLFYLVFFSVRQLVGGDFTTEPMVKSCRIRTGRGVKGMCFPPAMSRAERREVERLIVEGLKGLTGDLAGTYYPLAGMNKDDEAKLIAVSNKPPSKRDT